MFRKNFSLKFNLKIWLSFTIAVAFFITPFLFFILPDCIYAQDENFSSAEDQGFILSESKESYIKEVDTAGFPNISIYFNFRTKDYDIDSALTGNQQILDGNDLKIIENGREIKDFKIEQIGQTSEMVGVVLVVDTSGSMKGDPLINAKTAAYSFIERMREIDKTALIGFADTSTIFSSFTSDKKRLVSAVEELNAGGETALFDGIIRGLEQFNSFKELKHKYLIVLSDGADTVSVNNVNTVIQKAKQQDVVIYSIGLISKEFNPESIETIADSSGGHMLLTSDSEKLKDLYKVLQQEIQSLYKISYRCNTLDAETISTNILIENDKVKDSFNITYENRFTNFSGSSDDAVDNSAVSISNLIFLDIWWVKLIIYLLTFTSVTLFIYAVSSIMIPQKQELKVRTDYFLYNISEEGADLSEAIRKPRFSFFRRFSKKSSKMLSKKGFTDVFDEKLKRAGMNIDGSKFVFIHILSVAVATLVIFVLTRNFLLTLCVVILIIFMPFLFINFKIGQKLKKFNEQLPDTLQLIEGALKAGYSLNQALAMVTKETKPPISEEFTIALNEIRMGLSEKDALENMAVRINSELFNWVVLAINIQREVGGNLAEIMDIIANTIREKERVLRQIKALTAEGKLSAYVLIGLPIVLAVALSILNRQYIGVLFTTRIGFMMLGVAAILMIIGIIWILKIIKIDY